MTVVGTRTPLHRGLFALAAVLVVTALAPLVIPARAAWWYDVLYDYYGLAALVSLTLVVGLTTARRRHAQVPFEWRSWAFDLALAVGVVAVMLAVGGVRFRVLVDESHLVGVSQGMFLWHKSSLCYQGEYVFELPQCLSWQQDHRGHLFPFLAHLVHAVRGYAVGNGFVTNALLGVGALLAGARLIRLLRGPQLVVALWMVLMAALPLVGHSLGAAGVEPALLAMVMLALVSSALAVREPSRLHLGLVVLVFGLLTCTRNEAAAFALPLMVLVAVIYLPRVVAARPLWWEVGLYPLAFAPAILHVRAAPPDAYQAIGQPLFGLVYFGRYVGENLRFLTNLSERNELSLALAIVAVVGLGLGLEHLVRRLWRAERPTAWWLIAATAAVPLAFLVYTSFYAGDFTEVVAMRYALGFAPALALPAAYALWRLLQKIPGLALLVAAALFVYHAPALASDADYRTLLFPHEQTFVYQFTERHADKRLLFLWSQPHIAFIKGHSAVDYDFALQQQAWLEDAVGRGRYDGVMLVTGYQCAAPGVDLNKVRHVNESDMYGQCVALQQRYSGRLRQVERFAMTPGYFVTFWQIMPLPDVPVPSPPVPAP